MKQPRRGIRTEYDNFYAYCRCGKLKVKGQACRRCLRRQYERREKMKAMLHRITGSNGTPVRDSLSRGLIVAALEGLLSFGVVRVDALTVEDIAYLTPALTIVGFLLWGLWDRFGRPRFPSA